MIALVIKYAMLFSSRGALRISVMGSATFKLAEGFKGIMTIFLEHSSELRDLETS